MLQFTFNGLVTGSLYALLGVSFAFVLQVTGRLHVAYVATYALAPYVGIWLVGLNVPIWMTVVAGLLATAGLGMLIEVLVYQPVSVAAQRRRADPLIPIFVASLGLTIAAENALQYFFGAPPIAFNVVTSRAVHFWRIGTTNIALISIGISWLSVIGLTVLLRRTTLGMRIRAVGQNPVFAQVLGIRPRLIYVAVFGITSILAGVLGDLSATTAGASPTMGFDSVFYAFIVAFLAGVERGPVAIGLVGLVLGQVAGGLGGEIYSDQLAPVVMFSILLAYLCLKSVQGSRSGLALRSFARRLRLPARV